MTTQIHARTDHTADAVLRLLAVELGAEVVHEGPGPGCAVCTGRDDRAAA